MCTCLHELILPGPHQGCSILGTKLSSMFPVCMFLSLFQVSKQVVLVLYKIKTENKNHDVPFKLFLKFQLVSIVSNQP